MATLPSLLEKHTIGRADLLQVDTEVHDFRIVKAALEAGLRPALINYEHVNLSRLEQSRCKHMLYDLGYRFIDIGIDTLCCLPGAIPRAATGGDGAP